MIKELATFYQLYTSIVKLSQRSRFTTAKNKLTNKISTNKHNLKQNENPTIQMTRIYLLFTVTFASQYREQQLYYTYFLTIRVVSNIWLKKCLFYFAVAWSSSNFRRKNIEESIIISSSDKNGAFSEADSNALLNQRRRAFSKEFVKMKKLTGSLKNINNRNIT